MKLLILSITAMLVSTVNAQSLTSRADSLKVRYTFYEWNSKGQIYLTDIGSLERQFPNPVFLRVDTDRNTGFTLIEGFLNNSGSKKDTFGLCCFDILVARVNKSEKLFNIRRYGITLMASDSSNRSARDGFFRFEVKLNQDDILLVGNAGTLYWGAALVPIGELLLK